MTMLYKDAKELDIAAANDDDLQAAWHSTAGAISYHHADDSGGEWALAVPMRDRLKEIETEIKRRGLPRPTGNYLISSYDRIEWEQSA